MENTDEGASKYVIRATVSGGVTGYRSSLCKSEGKLLVFNSREEADKRAQEYRASIGRNSMASFSYVVEPFEGL